MGDSISEGTIVDIPVVPGDFVKADDVVVVLETDKVTVDVRAPEAGCIVEIMGEVDNIVEVGEGLFRLDTDKLPTPKAATTPLAT
jgi:2-oxoglutarate dehydrogenase E2 component (dihydrolipoamide succinyltransferase)